MKNWKTNLSGAFAALGTFLAGYGVLSDVSTKMGRNFAVAGFICNGLGIFFGHLFAADASQVKEVQQQVDSIKTQQESNTDFISKQQVGQPTK